MSKEPQGPTPHYQRRDPAVYASAPRGLAKLGGVVKRDRLIKVGHAFRSVSREHSENIAIEWRPSQCAGLPPLLLGEREALRGKSRAMLIAVER